MGAKRSGTAEEKEDLICRTESCPDELTSQEKSDATESHMEPVTGLKCMQRSIESGGGEDIASDWDAARIDVIEDWTVCEPDCGLVKTFTAIAPDKRDLSFGETFARVSLRKPSHAR